MKGKKNPNIDWPTASLDERGGLDPKTTASPTCMQSTRQGPLINTNWFEPDRPGVALSLTIWGTKEVFSLWDSDLHKILRDRRDWDRLPPFCA